MPGGNHQRFVLAHWPDVELHATKLGVPQHARQSDRSSARRARGGGGRAARGTPFGGRRTRCPRVAQHPEVIAALLLVVVAGGAERFQALDLGLDVVGTPPPASRWTPTATCSRRRWRRWPTASNWSGTRPWRGWRGPSTDQQGAPSENASVADLLWWRRLRGSNPRGG
jgi:hypothetical protein